MPCRSSNRCFRGDPEYSRGRAACVEGGPPSGATPPHPPKAPARPPTRRKGGDGRGLRLAEADVEALRESAARSVEALADRYFLEAVGRPEVSVGADAIRITVPIRKMS